MRLHEKRQDIEEDVARILKEKKSIGFVPTMGALHEGHIALVKNALANNDYVIVSIFVNPTQFNNSSDLVKYPRTLNSDLKLLSDTSPNLIVFAPAPIEVYGVNQSVLSYDFDGLEHVMEGEFRPGHFDGVGTVLKHLFQITSPTRAYFGEKDFQQLQIVRKLVSIENLPIKIIGCPIHRHLDGLAMSSRNKRLKDVEKENASLIYSVLQEVKSHFGTKSVDELKDLVAERFKNNAFFKLEYFQIADSNTLQPILERKNDCKYRAFIAVFAGEVRLIDNIALN
ncbi:pantoate--beta-alanine ligase [Aquimarina intermedia]|uniref:Pantothenate synthetase n=1 Tax=Aquimarina intermedia TaxID=350814 RepID=A0A5S5CFL2_9FLAO|nr:pantoate--beta-alanine ligase [Aquimarina intermedia]TYP77086.1 pantothenate synthetase [Aquimarina intermedia]